MSDKLDYVYEIEGNAIWFARLDESVIQDMLLAITQVLMTYGGVEPRVEAREVHFVE